MNILLIEDEEATARRLRRMVQEVEPTARIVGMTVSVDESVEWLQTHPRPDLILMDIELADGQSFEIFNRVTVTSPVVFTTAYDEYAIKAFRVNSIDYLLKPVKEDDLRNALTKLQCLKESLLEHPDSLKTSLTNLLRQMAATASPESSAQPVQTASTYRDRFLIRQGQRLFSVDVAEVAYVFTRNKLTFLKTRDGHEWMIDYSMDEVSTMLDPQRFFRLNRQIIAELRAIDKVNLYFNGKLKIGLRPIFDEEVIVSREKAGEFKVWLGE
ncbi:LytTR family two component transcriptional regulator [Larkinella arboricola]|uniref:LytTR family two component transcriptional regulator n=1 Tax=Larkinella arboricola TaxID=643671 RepID=A0A327WPY5_LARAB|nr:LytTR family DNA-binding domain-containing protein [Larkinella arboricola]RAJ93999.1 LytTR family two component transcriptional regulator [Larkinella arboricola]